VLAGSDTSDVCEPARTRVEAIETGCGESLASGQEVRVEPRVLAASRREGEPEVVWVATHLVNAERARGPLAIVERTALGLEVQALGIYEGPIEVLDVRLFRVAGAYVVAIEQTQEGGSMLELLVQSGGALVVAGFEDVDGRCTDTARVTVRGAEFEPLGGGWSRRTTRTSTLLPTPTALVVQEHLTVEEVETARPDSPPRSRADADGVRYLVPHGSRLLPDRPGLDARPAE
jgi:hypothetical protein